MRRTTEMPSAAVVEELDGELGFAAVARRNPAGLVDLLRGGLHRRLAVDVGFGDHPARLGSASGLIGELGMGPPHFVRRSSDWPL
jgi:hypothetical protein